MLILGTEEHFDPPCPARVVAVVRGHGQWLRRYVLLEVEDPDGSRRDVVATLRTRRRWRRPPGAPASSG